MSRQGRRAFSYAVPVGNISANPVTVRMSASEEEREGAREAMGSLGRLCARGGTPSDPMEAGRRAGQAAKSTPSLCSRASCRWSPSLRVIDEPVDALFVPEGSRLARARDRPTAGSGSSTPRGPMCRRPFPATRSMSEASFRSARRLPSSLIRACPARPSRRREQPAEEDTDDNFALCRAQGLAGKEELGDGPVRQQFGCTPR